MSFLIFTLPQHNISQPYCTYICKVLSNIDLKLLKISAIPIFKKTSSAGCWWQRFMGLKYFVKDSANKILGIKKICQNIVPKLERKKFRVHKFCLAKQNFKKILVNNFLKIFWSKTLGHTNYGLKNILGKKNLNLK